MFRIHSLPCNTLSNKYKSILITTPFSVYPKTIVSVVVVGKFSDFLRFLHDPPHKDKIISSFHTKGKFVGPLFINTDRVLTSGFKLKLLLLTDFDFNKRFFFSFFRSYVTIHYRNEYVTYNNRPER